MSFLSLNLKTSFSSEMLRRCSRSKRSLTVFSTQSVDECLGMHGIFSLATGGRACGVGGV